VTPQVATHDIDAAASRSLRNDSARAVYAHIPFCRHRCGYCDFTLVARREDLIPDFIAALELELDRVAGPHPVETLFVGGGTPTHLPPRELHRVLTLLQRTFPLNPGGEFSVEANPAGLTDEHLSVMRDAGVNRISLGVQSFDDRELKLLERDHTGDSATDAAQRVQSKFENVSFDLIFGIPGQSLEDWRRTLERALSLQPRHISTYGLTFERGTTFWSRRERGVLRQAPEELERELYALAMDLLSERGYPQYELSNFAQPRYACRHNQVYWRGESYFGVGPGAASYLGGVRRQNHRSVTTWIRRTLAGESAISLEEQLTEEATGREAIMLGLRQRAGIDLAEFERRYRTSPAQLEPTLLTRHLADGLLETVNGRLRLTRNGCFVADSVMSDYL
jgi:oxygen-independent coproporphyrinogen-3 oxidase